MLVTVITPSLNGMRWLRACIDSVQCQAGPGVEVEHVFVDGGSTDGTAEYAASRGCTVLTREDPRIHYAVNKGAFNSNGELLGVLGCDDVLLPEALEAVVRQYRRDGRRWLVGGVRWVDDRGRSLGELRPPPSWIPASMVASLGWNPIPHVYLSREFLVELGGYNPDFYYTGDYELHVRALQREPFSRVRRILAATGRHESNVSRQMTPKHLAEIEAVAELAAPSSPWRRAACRQLMKVWVNSANPSWALLKRSEAFRARRYAASGRAQRSGG
jgi:glycosyltransferase involved in cell wall biosynthesis